MPVWAPAQPAIYSVKAYGAKGDGTSDDTSAIASTVTAAGTGTVYFPAGTYITTPIAISSRVSFLLDGGATLKLKANSTAAPVVRFNADDCVIRGGSIDGNRANQSNGTSSTAMHGVHLNGHRCKALGLTIQACFNDGVRIGEVDDCEVSGNRITGTALAGSSGIQQQINDGRDCFRTLIADNVVDLTSGSAATVDSGGISLTSGATHAKGIYDAVISNNRITQTLSPVSLNPSAITVFYAAGRTVIEGNTCIGGSMGMSLAATNGVACKGNTVRSPNYTGIEIAGSARCAVSGNTIDGNGVTPSGIISSGTSPAPSDSAITGNTITGTTTAGVNINKGDRTVIQGNVINVTAARAILLNGPVDITITGNALIGNGTGTVGIDAVNATRHAIAGNIIKGFATSGITISASTAVTLSKLALGSNVFDSNTADITVTLSGGATLTAGANGMTVRGNVGSAGDYIDWTGNVRFLIGTGTPEGAVTAGVGSQFLRTDGGATTTLYVKTSGTGNMGWTAK